MKRISRVGLSLLITFVIGLGIGCSGGSGPSFNVATTIMVNGLMQPEAGVTIAGVAGTPSIDCAQNPMGTSQFGPLPTDANGVYKVSNAAYGPNCGWSFNRYVSAHCPQPTFNDVMFVTIDSQTVHLPCAIPINTFSANPFRINVNSPPSTFNITGHGMDATYGLPQVWFYNQNRTVLLRVTAVSASSDGSLIGVPASNVTFGANGSYAAVVYVRQSTGTWSPVGGAEIYIYGNVTAGGGGCFSPVGGC